MRKKNRKRYCFAFALNVLLAGCISIPERPISDAPQCIGNLFVVRREVREIKEENALFQTAMGFAFTLPIWFGPWSLLIPAIGIPVGQLQNRDRAKRILDEWRNRDCLPGTEAADI